MNFEFALPDRVERGDTIPRGWFIEAVGWPPEDGHDLVDLRFIPVVNGHRQNGMFQLVAVSPEQLESLAVQLLLAIERFTSTTTSTDSPQGGSDGS